MRIMICQRLFSDERVRRKLGPPSWEDTMPKVSLAFFTVAPIYVLIGMFWGMYMGGSGDHGMAPAHAHLNLLGFVQMSIFGTFYALAAGKYSETLARLNFGLSNAAVVIMIPVLVLILSGGDGDPSLPLKIAI